MRTSIAGIDVSRETMERLELLDALLHKWSPKINLVSRSTLQTSWRRHIEDSAQIFGLLDQPAKTWVDIGSGGGFPALVIAAIAAEKLPDMTVTMVESDQRKCAFLRTALREMQVKGEVIAERIEHISARNADVLSARALSSLEDLFVFAKLHLAPDGVCLFPKGATWEKEVTQARKSWSFDVNQVKSKTDENAVILKVKALSHG